MTRTKTLSVLLFLSLSFSGLISRAQTVTNKAGLQQASQLKTQQFVAFQKILQARAIEKGWPLTIHGKKGQTAYLRGINTKGQPIYITTTDNIISAATIRTNQLWPGGSTGLNLSGGSIPAMKGKIAVWDEGLVRPTHVELTGRVTQADGATNLADHSTHVAGTMIAKGVNPLAKGMANSAQLLSCYDFNNDQAEMMNAAANGLLVSNHSYANIAGWYFNGDQSRWEFWGNPGDTVDISFGLYDDDAKVWDSIAYNAPNYLIAKAAGNNRGETGPLVGQPYYRYNAQGVMAAAGNRPAGISSNDSYNTIATYGCSKNILTIGAVNPIPGGYSRPSDVVMADFSSWGPTGDGRIKPDLVADGVNVLSSVSSADNAYDIMSGTSMATPASAGSSFLLQEYYAKLHSGSYLRSSALKGLLIHTADEAGSAPGPDYMFGWGLINMQRAAAVITSDNTDHAQQIIQRQLTSVTREKDSVTIIASGKTPLAATLCWTDLPGTPAIIPNNEQNFQDVTIKLVNDLDLRIVDSNTNKTYLPWILDPNNRPAAATKGDNIRDNVEKVELSDTVAPGHTYKIYITHKGTLSGGAQAYSLLVSGGGGQAYCSSASTSGGASIDKVTLGTFSVTNPSGPCRTYTDLSGQGAAILPVGQPTTLSIAHSSCTGSNNTRIISVYIDYNNNGTFEAGELAAQSGAVLSGTFTPSIAAPVSAIPGTHTRMRIIAQETSNPSAVNPCGTYGAGETQDYTIVFTNPSTDVGVVSLEYPTATTCASDSQIVSVRIRNFGSQPQFSVPVSTTVKDGSGNTVATFSATCKDSIPAGSDVVFTYNGSFRSVTGNSYSFVSSTALSGDMNTTNDASTTAISINAGSAAITGTAVICPDTIPQAQLTANASGSDVAVWYADPTTTTPLGTGNSVTTTTIPSNNTYYLGINELSSKAGPANKLAVTGGQGAYFRFGGNFLRFTTSVPLTLESTRLYVGHAGKITFTLATLAAFSRSGGYNYYPLYTTTIDVAPTKAVPDTNAIVRVAAGDNSDTGATYYLNIPVPVPGNYILIIDCSSYASGFLNYYPTNTSSLIKGYPFTLPGVISITGNDMQYNPDVVADSVTYFQHFYYPFYNLGVRLYGCPGPRTAVQASSLAQPTVTLSGNVLTSSVATGNNWYRIGSDSLLGTGQTLTAVIPGAYRTLIKDPAANCTLTSNVVNYLPSDNPAGLLVWPNPTSGPYFTLQFYFSNPDNTSITLYNMMGQRVYTASYSSFSGWFMKQLSFPELSAGIYNLQILHGGQKYNSRIFIRRL